MNFRELLLNVSFDSVIPELACLSVDLIFLGVFYRLYRKKSRCVEALQDAPEFELDTKLQQKIQKADLKAIPYAVVRGAVRGTHEPLLSQHVPGVSGVIQLSEIIEHKVQWSPFSRWWSDSRYEIQHYINEIPFHLSNAAIWNKVRVHIEEPLTADGLELSTVYDKFIPKSDTLGGYIIGWVRGERSKGFQVTEKLLTEGTVLTGVGELILKSKEIYLRPSENHEFFLTTLTKDGLVKKLEKDIHFYKVFTAAFGILGVYILFLVGRSWYVEHRNKVQAIVDEKKRQDARKQRLRNSRGSGQMDYNATPVCVVCLNNPVEVMVMECGHVCLCTDCSEKVAACPICRTSIAQTVAAFFP